MGLANEEELIGRMSERSKKVLLDVKSKIFRTAKQLNSSLDQAGQEALTKALQDISRVVTQEGVVDHSAMEEVKSSLEGTWKRVSQASKGSIPVMYLFNALDRFITVAMLASILQNARMVERAKSNSQVRDKLYSVMEQMAKVIPQIQGALHKAVDQVPGKAEPDALPTDSTAEEAVTKQLGDAEREMRGIVSQLEQLIVKKAEELFGEGSELAEAIDENIFSIFNKRQVNPQLNKDRAFYQDALHLEHSPTKIDLGEFLDTKQKKAVYLCYRSFVMAARALGVVQHAKQKPELVIKNPKLQELVVKAQQILVKRKDTIVSYMKALKKPEKETKDKVRGIPKGTFSDFFSQ